MGITVVKVGFKKSIANKIEAYCIWNNKYYKYYKSL
jgi:hypothetical protein